ncbi:MAG: rhodanese-like domain-containing protein [Bacteroidota bacterium]|nr:rhodanese-like domain-containing protein [Bacteroidota bacterium]
MKQMLILIVSLSLLSAAFGQAEYYEQLNNLYRKSVPFIDATELKEKIENEEKVYLLDTRPFEEFKVSHLEGARQVGYESFRIREVKDIPEDATIVVYCSLGIRSEEVGEKLIEKGFENVFNLYGGMFEWYYQECPVVDMNNKETDKIHAYNADWARWLRKGEAVY